MFSNVIGSNSKILFNRDPAQRVEAVAPWLTTDSAVYPAIVNKRLVWIVDGYTTLDNYPYSELTSLSSATADSNEVAFNRLVPDKKVSYIRNSVKATVDAYDGTVTLYQQDEKDPVLKAWMQVFPGTVKPKSDIAPELAEHLRYPEDLFKVQRMLLAKYHVNDPVTFFSTSDFWDVPLDPNPTASSYQPPYYIVAKNIAKDDNSASYQLISAMNRFKRDYLAAYISASSDPATYGNLTVLTIPGQVNGPKLANNAITTDPAVSQDLGVIGRDNQNRIRWGNLLTPWWPGRTALRRTGLCIPGSQRRCFVLPAADPGGDDVQRQGGIRPHGAGCAHRLVRARGRCDGYRDRAHGGSGTTESRESTAACQWTPTAAGDCGAPGSRRGGHLIAGQSCCAAGDPGCHRRGAGCAEEGRLRRLRVGAAAT